MKPSVRVSLVAVPGWNGIKATSPFPPVWRCRRRSAVSRTGHHGPVEDGWGKVAGGVGDVAAATLHKRAAWVAEIDRLPLDGELDTASPAAPLLPTNAEGQTAVMPTVLALRPARRGWSRLLAISLALLTMAGVAVAFSRDWSRQNVAPAEPEPAPTTPMAVSAAEPPAVAPAPVAEEPTTASPTVASPASPPKAASRGRDAKSSPSARAAPTSTAKSCRYFDERERIWKFRVECYE